MSLDAGDHFAWLVLRKVKASGIARHGERYLKHGQPMGVLLGDIVAVLVAEGEITLGEPDPDGPRWAVLSDAGAARYAALCRRQRSGLQIPPPEHRSTETPAGHRMSDPRATAPGDRPDPSPGVAR